MAVGLIDTLPKEILTDDSGEPLSTIEGQLSVNDKDSVNVLNNSEWLLNQILTELKILTFLINNVTEKQNLDQLRIDNYFLNNKQ